MKSYSLSALSAVIDAANVPAAGVVMIPSSLLALGRCEGVAPVDVPGAIARRIMEALGPHRTLVVPTFNFGFCKGVPFDRQLTPAENMGQISEVVRTMPGAIRSRHPMQSVAAVGPLAPEICATDTPGGYDPAGPFGVMMRAHATLVLLGATINAGSFIHYAEECQSVPYRYWKKFSGFCIDQGLTRAATYRMFVRDYALAPRLRMDPVDHLLSERRLIAKHVLGAGRVSVCSFADLLAVATDCLRLDPWCFVSGRPASASCS